MLRKNPKSSGLKSFITGGIKTVLLFETALLLSTYIAWQQLKSSRDCFVNDTYHFYWISIIRSKNIQHLRYKIEFLTKRSGLRKGNYLNDYSFSMALFIKSITWLLGTGGFSYILFKTITPDENELRKYLPQSQVHHNPKLNNQPLFMESLRKAALEKKSMVKKGTESEIAKSSNTPNLVEK